MKVPASPLLNCKGGRIVKGLLIVMKIEMLGGCNIDMGQQMEAWG